jgi:hypothetical protein
MVRLNSDRHRSLLAEAADPSPEVHRAALAELMNLVRQSGRPESDFFDIVREILLREWEQLGTESAALVDPLVARFTSPDTSMLDMEIIAPALALQGEDGLTELIAFLHSDDFVLRHKAAVGLGVLGRSARWAVPTVIRALYAESQPLVRRNLLHVLGCIGGPIAVDTLENIYSKLRESEKPDPVTLEAVEGALASARIEL